MKKRLIDNKKNNYKNRHKYNTNERYTLNVELPPIENEIDDLDNIYNQKQTKEDTQPIIELSKTQIIIGIIIFILISPFLAVIMVYTGLIPILIIGFIIIYIYKSRKEK